MRRTACGVWSTRVLTAGQGSSTHTPAQNSRPSLLCRLPVAAERWRMCEQLGEHSATSHAETLARRHLCRASCRSCHAHAGRGCMQQPAPNSLRQAWHTGCQPAAALTCKALASPHPAEPKLCTQTLLSCCRVPSSCRARISRLHASTTASLVLGQKAMPAGQGRQQQRWPAEWAVGHMRGTPRGAGRPEPAGDQEKARRAARQTWGAPWWWCQADGR